MKHTRSQRRHRMKRKGSRKSTRRQRGGDKCWPNGTCSSSPNGKHSFGPSNDVGDCDHNPRYMKKVESMCGYCGCIWSSCLPKGNNE